MVTYLPRSAWKARPSRGPSSLSASSVVGVALHWPGMAKPINATGDIGMRRVASALRGWQNYHMDDRGWSDIAYCVAVDQAGRAWTLRGVNIKSGANGDANVNNKYGAILLVLAPGEKPTAAMKTTVKGVMGDYRKRFSKVRAKPYGHRDVRPAGTDCPGPLAYAAIGRGEFTLGTPSKPSTPVEDTMNADQQKLMTDGFAAIQDRITTLKAEVNNYSKSLDSFNDLDIAALKSILDEHTATLSRIEDDTDDGTAAPKG